MSIKNTCRALLEALRSTLYDALAEFIPNKFRIQIRCLSGPSNPTIDMNGYFTLVVSSTSPTCLVYDPAGSGNINTPQFLTRLSFHQILCKVLLHLQLWLLIHSSCPPKSRTLSDVILAESPHSLNSFASVLLAQEQNSILELQCSLFCLWISFSV